MNILISGPSLDSKKNVSGISSVVNSILRYNHHHHYFHFEIGKKDKKESFYLDYLFEFYIIHIL